ncbi:MAG: hypothetical protein KDD65_02610 [Bacteroidetes bacterium]|nr:hypothetical protein [Bacteroidota bacterium]
MAARFGDRVIDFRDGFGTPDGDQDPKWDAGDNLHYNNRAHGIMFERVRDAGIESVVK